MAIQSEPISPPWRRFLRFSVRGLIVLVPCHWRVDWMDQSVQPLAFSTTRWSHLQMLGAL